MLALHLLSALHAATKINTEIVTCFLGKCINQVKDFVLKPQPSSGQPKGWTI